MYIVPQYMSHPPLRTDGHPRHEAIPPNGVTESAPHFQGRTPLSPSPGISGGGPGWGLFLHTKTPRAPRTCGESRPRSPPGIEACLIVSVDGLPKQGIAGTPTRQASRPLFPQHCSGAGDLAAPLNDALVRARASFRPRGLSPARHCSNRPATTTQTEQKEP